MTPNDSLEFTRDDADRLTRIETAQNNVAEKMDTVINLALQHAEQHKTLEIDIDRNTRFRKIVTNIAIWVATSSGLATLLAAGAKAIGWLK